MSERNDILAVNKKEWLNAQAIGLQLAALDPQNPDLIRMQPLVLKGLERLKIQDVENRGLLAFFSGD